MKDGDCLYFGCGTTSGHHLWVSNNGRMGYAGSAVEDYLPFPYHNLDGNFIPDSCRWVNGFATLTNKDGFTMLAFPDNTIDTRQASHSTFAIKGTFSYDESVAIARDSYSDVWGRMKFEVVDKTQ